MSGASPATPLPPASRMPRPLRPLAGTAILLAIFLAVSTIVIGGVHWYFNKRMDSYVLDETINRCWDFVDKGQIADAENLLIEVSEARPNLEQELAWRFANYFVVMPAFRARIANGTDDGPLQAELAIRLRKVSGDLPGPYRQLAQTDPLMGNPVDAIAGNIPDDQWRALNMRALPAQVWKRSLENDMQEQYVAGWDALALNGDRTAARHGLQTDWEKNARPDSAFWLGVLAEADGNVSGAIEWYSKALALGNAHMGAARRMLALTQSG